MKNRAGYKCISVLFLLLPALVLKAQNARLKKLYLEKDFLTLAAELDKTNTGKNEKNLYWAFVYNAYNKPQESLQLLTQLEEAKAFKKGDSLDFYLQLTTLDNHVKLFEYKKAADRAKNLLATYTSFYDREEIEDEKQAALLWQYLSKEPAQTVLRNGDTRLPFKEWHLPVGNGKGTYDFIFDTGAGFSTITKSMAQKMNLRMVKDAFVEIGSGITGIGTKVQLGIAPQLLIGNIVVKNAAFFVFPDEALSFPLGNGDTLVLNGILGFPVIKEFGEFTIANNEIFIPAVTSTDAMVERNMIIDLLKPILYMRFNGRYWPFTFDSGADHTMFNDKFYLANKKVVDKTGTAKEVSIGGTGGVVKQPVIEVPELTFYVQKKPAVFKKAEISTAPIPTNGKVYYGNVGQDLMGQFKKMTVNFQQSYISFE